MRVFKCILIGLGLFISSASFGQDAKTVLDKLSKKVKSYTSIHAEFSMKIVDDKEGGDVVNTSGTATIQGEKFKLLMDDYHLYCDGTTLWTYDTENNGCVINDYEEMQDEQDISPSELFTIWEKGFKQEHKGTVTEDGVSYTKINLYPTDKDAEFHTITLLIDESKMELKKATIKSNDGQTMTYTIKSFTPNKEVSDADFTFKKADHPGCECDDQRF